MCKNNIMVKIDETRSLLLLLPEIEFLNQILLVLPPFKNIGPIRTVLRNLEAGRYITVFFLLSTLTLKSNRRNNGKACLRIISLNGKGETGTGPFVMFYPFPKRISFQSITNAIFSATYVSFKILCVQQIQYLASKKG